MISFFVLILMSLGVCILILVVALYLSFKGSGFRGMSTPFDCGFDPILGCREPMSIRFFIVGVLFVVFDVEVVLLLPMLSSLSVGSLVIFSLCMLILLLGLGHEWREGSLNWQS